MLAAPGMVCEAVMTLGLFRPPPDPSAAHTVVSMGFDLAPRAWRIVFGLVCACNAVLCTCHCCVFEMQLRCWRRAFRSRMDAFSIDASFDFVCVCSLVFQAEAVVSLVVGYGYDNYSLLHLI